MTIEPMLIWLINLALKGLFVLALGLVIVSFMRRCSGAARHMIAAMALGSALLLPGLSALLPQWDIPILPASLLDDNRVAPARPREPISATARNLAALLGLPGADWRGELPLSGALALSRRELAGLILLIWASGVALAMIPCLAGAWIVGRAGRRAQPVTDIYIASMFRGLMGEYSIRRNVRLLVGAQSITPMAWGVFRPCVLLPPEALCWPADRLRAALLHELAHVKRWDCATQFLGQIACAMHWFNPMGWLMARQLRAEHERACDDMVLTWGLGEAAYAEHLVVIARSLRAPAMSWMSAVAMARPSQLRRRLVSILDPQIRRGRFGFRTILAGMAVALALTAPLAMMHAATSPAPTQAHR